METYDIILDSDGELQEVSGDFKKGDNANNLLSYLIQANKGEYKEYPLLGMGINNYLNDTKNPQQIKRDIRVQLSADVFPDADIDISEFPTIKINKTVIKIGD